MKFGKTLCIVLKDFGQILGGLCADFGQSFDEFEQSLDDFKQTLGRI